MRVVIYDGVEIRKGRGVWGGREGEKNNGSPVARKKSRGPERAKLPFPGKKENKKDGNFRLGRWCSADRRIRGECLLQPNLRAKARKKWKKPLLIGVFWTWEGKNVLQLRLLVKEKERGTVKGRESGADEY